MDDPKLQGPYQLKKVGEIMIPIAAYPKVGVRSTLAEAIAVMKEAHLEFDRRRSLPRVVLVLNEREELVGCVRRRDIMRGLEPKFLVSQPLSYRGKLFDVSVDPNLSQLSFDKVVAGVRGRATRPVSDMMHPFETTVDFDDHLIKAVYEMVTGDLALIPVLREGRPVGVIRSVDVFHELIRVLD